MQTIMIDPWTDRDRVRAIWTELASVTQPPPSYFLGWAWVENWLVTLPVGTRLQLVVLADDTGVPQATFFLGERVVMHGGVIPIRARFLNTTGDPELDELTIEYNCWLARPDAAITIADVVAAIAPGWDELVMPKLASDPTAIKPPWPARYGHVKHKVSHYVDLARVRGASDYLDVLQPQTRSQIKRAERLYAERGPIRVEIAGDRAHARAIFDDLVALHTATWKSRGGVGAFTPYMRRFHTRLIDERFASGEIQLVRVAAGDQTIGCLYNLVRDRDIAFYQSGFAYERDNRMKPGLVCHAQAIRYCAAAGHRMYDFLAGDARYKRSLATDAAVLVDATVQLPCVRFALETHARNLLRSWHEFRAA
jgi:CelD/BcsL family acetyltransferase involved in cellulose biosynthesis